MKLSNNPGIYFIHCKGNDKYYIGSSLKVKSRITEHKRQLRKDCHFNKYLQRAWNKYSKDMFEFDIIKIFDNNITLFQLREIEGQYIKKYDSFLPHGFNIVEDPKVGPRLLGSDNGMYGKTHSIEARNKISMAHKDIPLSQSHKENISEATKGEKNHFYGKNHSKETKEKMSKNHANVSGNKNPFYRKGKLSTKDVVEIIETLKSNKFSHRQIANKYNVSRQIITGINIGVIFKDVPRQS